MDESPSLQAGSPASKNVVLVSIDSLRADHCGYLGSEYDLTPTLDALAAEGIAFENAVAPGPQTFSSMPDAFTGQYRPPEEADDDSGWQRRLGLIDSHLDRHPTLPERLQELGYETAAITPNPWTSEAAGFDRGFDHFRDLSGADGGGRLDRVVEALPGIDGDDRRLKLLWNLLTGSSFFNRWESIYKHFQLLRTRLSEPYFIWVFLLDTHYPFITGRTHRDEQSLRGMYLSSYRSEAAMRGNAETMSPAVRESLQRSYRDTVGAVDGFLAKLWRDVAADDPAVIVHSDHGESFGEHGNYGHHHRQLYEENIHVPYVVANAGCQARIEAPTTLASLPELTLDVATSGAVDPRRVTAPRVLSTNVSGTVRAVRQRRYKFIQDGSERLFDLERDPNEQTDVSTDAPEELRASREYLDRHDGHIRELSQLSDAAATLEPEVPL